MKLTDARLKEVILHDKRHKNYLETVKEQDHLCFHIEGYEFDWYGEKIHNYTLPKFSTINFLDYPFNIWFNILIGEYRPEESRDGKAYEYRMKNYKAVTKSTVSQVISEFQKITRSSDWQVKFTGETPSGVPESLEDYFHNYPRWGDFTNFIQSVLVKKVCSDPNALIVVMPYLPKTKAEVDEMDDTKLPKPQVSFYASRYVLDYSDTNYAICYDKSEEVYCVYTKESMSKYKRGSDELVRTFYLEYDVPLETFNCKKTKGIYKDSDEDTVLYESFVSPMLPYLDKAARESSDLDASTVRAMFPQAWQWAGMNCSHCNGSGKVPQMGKQVICSQCNGLGSVAHSPSQVITVKADRLAADQQLPIPPKGFIEPTTAIIELQMKSIQDHKYEALAALNFQNLHRVPLNESGKAKEVDREEVHNTVQKVAENIVENAMFIAKATNELRYMKIARSAKISKKAIDEMLPSIPVPEDFSIVTAEAYLEEMEKAKVSGLSAATRKEIEMQYIKKRWRNNQEEAKRLLLYIELNPYYGREAEVAVSMDADPLQKFISLNIMYLVDEAIEENDKFLEMEISEQREIIERMAEDRMPSPADDELGMIDDEGGGSTGQSGGGVK